MFPHLRERIGSALDLVVEFSTLGEYRLGADGTVCAASALGPALRPEPAQSGAPEREPQMGGAGDQVARRAAVRHIVAGGAAGTVPVATPAARRVLDDGGHGGSARTLDGVGGRTLDGATRALDGATRATRPCDGDRRGFHATAAHEQLCLAV